MDNLQKIQNILQRATDFLCPNLSLDFMLRKLVANRTILPADRQTIESNITQDAKVDKLLQILQLKPESSYIGFRDVLKSEREDLYVNLKALEKEFNYTPGNDYSNDLKKIIG